MWTKISPLIGILIFASISSLVLGNKAKLHGTSAILKNRIEKRAAKPEETSAERPLLVNPNTWDPKNCAKVSNMLVSKGRVIKRIKRLVEQIDKDENLPENEKKFQKKSFEIFGKELVETEELILESINWLDRVLKGDYRNVIKLRESSKARLDALRDATLKEEQEYQDILKAWEQLQQYNQTSVEGLIDEILKDVADAADQLQDQLDEHLFDKALHEADKGNGPNIEAVIRLGGGGGDAEPSGNASRAERSDNSVPKLVDAQDNQFVLAKGKDSTVPHEDHHFIQDVVFVLLGSIVFGWLCAAFGLPTMFGYIVCGVALGPSGMNILRSPVQLETVGQFGVFFILFCVGLEFSPAKLKQVLKVACIGTTLMMAMMVLCGVVLGYVWNASTNESVFVAACLSLSSTPLVVKFLNPGGEEGPSNTDYGNTLLGILIMQDVLLGLLMAVMPNMAPSEAAEVVQPEVISPYITTAVNLIGALLFVIGLCYVLAKWIIGPFYKYLLKLNNKEITLLATIGISFLMLSLTDELQVSMELGCFLAGAVVSAQGHGLVEQIELLMNPVKDFFACIFFASIGLHVFPQFMAYQMTVLTTLTMATIGAKYIISVTVLALLSPKGAWHVKWIVSAGLAQVSEFSFVLGSQARRLGLISREVYLLILGITTMSLICAPALWQLTLWQLRIKSGSQIFTNRVNLQEVSPTISIELGPQAPSPPSPVITPRRRQLST